MFIAFEGIDGSGKTTVSNMVVERLRARGLTVKHLRAEGKFVSSVSEAIRSLARDSKNLDLDPRAEFLLYVARDVQLIEEALRPALQTYDVVLADRFLYTAEVLARFGRSLPVEYVRPVLDAAAGGLAPDLVVLIDVDPVLARARRKSFKVIAKDSRPPSRKGLSGVGLQHRVRRGYLELAAAAPERWFVTTNEGALEDTVERVTDLIQRATAQGSSAALEHARSRLSARPDAAAEGSAPANAEQALEALERWLDARAEREPQVAAYVLGGLFGSAMLDGNGQSVAHPLGQKLDELRRTLARKVPTVVLSGLAGLDDEVSWQLRQQLLDAHPQAVARSLGGLANRNPRVAALREQLFALAPAELARSLAREDDEASWLLRDRLYGEHPDAVISSLAWLGSARARALREHWLGTRRGALADDYELARVAARSVHNVDDEQAWELRAATRAVAPIASLSSVGSLVCTRAWEQRERSLQRATKVVMETLRHLRDERAWQMRWQVATHTKEALDSVTHLDDEQAWALREAFCDVWPSTVVKTLGVLSDSERARALLERQLAAHPNNVSLLKHAAAIALGVHRAAHPHEEFGALSA